MSFVFIITEGSLGFDAAPAAVFKKMDPYGHAGSLDSRFPFAALHVSITSP